MMLRGLAPQLDVEPDPEYRRAARQRLVGMAAVRTPEPVRPSALRRMLVARAVLRRWTLATMDDQTSAGASWYLARAVDTSDRAPLDTVSRWAGDQSAQLDAASAGIPADAKDDVAASLGLLGAVTERADGLRAVLDCPGGPALAGTDRLGPVPGECDGGVEAQQAPPNSSPAPSEPVLPQGTPPQAVPGAPVEPTTSAGPPAGKAAPVPGPLKPQAPGIRTPSAAPGGVVPPPGLLPELTVPSLPTRTAPPTTPPATTSPRPLIDLPFDGDDCVALSPLPEC
jgi:hypothetical protein